MNGAPVCSWLVGRKQATAKTQYRGLSTAQWTVKLSIASVEMSEFLGGIEVVVLADFAVFEDFVEHSGEGAGAGEHGALGLRHAGGEGVEALAQGG